MMPVGFIHSEIQTLGFFLFYNGDMTDSSACYSNSYNVINISKRKLRRGEVEETQLIFLIN